MNKKTEKCKAKTKSGKQCRRKPLDSGYCKQHERMFVEQIPPLHSYPAGLMDYVPAPPSDLDDAAAGRFRQYCQAMIEDSRLRGVHLNGIYELCRLEQDMRAIDQDILIHGRYNLYTTQSGEVGLQPNGPAAELNKVIVRIEKYRQAYGFLPPDTKEAAKKPAQQSKPVPLRKVKNF